jgi:hypothetical protein
MASILGDEAVRSIKADLGLGLGPLSVIKAQGFVKIASEGLLVLTVNFGDDDPSDRGYYLYDFTDASLYMTHRLPSRLEASYTSSPVLRCINGGDPQLVLMAHMYPSY